MSTKQHGLFFKLTQRKALLALLVALAGAICLGGTGIVLADPLHCHRGGYPSCNSVGYADGWRQGVSDRNNQLDHNSSCPSGHSENFCAGYRDGYIQSWNPNSKLNSITIGQSQSSGVDLHGNDNQVTVNQGQNGQIGSDDGAGNGILPRCVILCGYINNH